MSYWYTMQSHKYCVTCHTMQSQVMCDMSYWHTMQSHKYCVTCHTMQSHEYCVTCHTDTLCSHTSTVWNVTLTHNIYMHILFCCTFSVKTRCFISLRTPLLCYLLPTIIPWEDLLKVSIRFFAQKKTINPVFVKTRVYKGLGLLIKDLR